MAKKQITLADIAKQCGTSTVTVSKALAGKSGVGEELRAKIKETADQMGYVPTKASAYKAGGNVGVVIPEKFMNPNGSFYWALYTNIIQRLKQEGFSCIQESLGPQEEQSLKVPNLLANNKISGLISLGQVSEEYAAMLLECTPNILLLDYYLPDIEADCVVTNGFLGGYKLTKHLIAAGHRDIGFIGTRLATSSIFDRYMGYLKAMIEQGLLVKDHWLVPDRDEDGQRFERFELPKELPTAFVCNCDEAAFTTIRSIKALGLSVPEDISVVGYDNYVISEICEPSITTIDVDAREMADAAVEMLLRRMNDPDAPARLQTVNGRLVEKGSVRKI